MTDTHKAYSLVLMILCLMAPLEAIILGQLIRKEKLKPFLWVSVVGVQLSIIVMAYVQRANGYEIVSLNSIDKFHVQNHIAQTEIFIALAIATGALSVVVIFLNTKLRYPIAVLTTLLMLIQSTMFFKLKQSGFEVFSNYQQPSAPEASIQEHPEIYDDNDYGEGELEELDESLEPED